MGRDKGLLDIHGIPQIEYVHHLLQPFCSEVYLSKRADQKGYKNIPMINDAGRYAGKGPLGGILSAMEAHPKISWLVVACDLPFVTAQTLQMLLEGRDHLKLATAYISSQDGLPEPLCAVWEAHGYREVLKLFEQGIHCPRKVLIRGNPCLIRQENPHWLDNINTFQEYQEIRRRA